LLGDGGHEGVDEVPADGDVDVLLGRESFVRPASRGRTAGGVTDDEFDARSPDAAVGIDRVDAQAGTRDIDPAGRASQQCITSPQDLTDIGLCVTNVTRGFHEQGVERARIGLLSLTEIFSYTGTETVFKFCNTATGRIANDDQVGFFTINSEVQDETGLATIRRVFDGTIELRAEGGREARLVTPDRETDWVAL